MNKNVRVEQVFNPHDWSRSNASRICSSVSSPGHIPATTSKDVFPGGNGLPLRTRFLASSNFTRFLPVCGR